MLLTKRYLNGKWLNQRFVSRCKIIDHIRKIAFSVYSEQSIKMVTDKLRRSDAFAKWQTKLRVILRELWPNFSYNARRFVCFLECGDISRKKKYDFLISGLPIRGYP